MKKILVSFFGVLLSLGVQAGPIANIEYIHDLIKSKWGIPLNYNPVLTSPRAAGNMEYLLTAVDVANEIMNERPTTEYAYTEFATQRAADTNTVNKAVDTLVKFKEWPFVITTTADTTFFRLRLSPRGRFYINWGDGTIEKIRRDSLESQSYSHNYRQAGTYTIKIDGYPTEYNKDEEVAAISFSDNTNIAEISGNLSGAFPTLSNGTQPNFYRTFYGCSQLSGVIPEDLFANIYGEPVVGMFRETFANCSQLTGVVPTRLFGNLDGSTKKNLFRETFYNCSSLTGIAEDAFGDLTGNLSGYMFAKTFAECTGLTGLSARYNNDYLYNIWPDARTTQVGDMYANATGLDDYISIPKNWGGLGYGQLIPVDYDGEYSFEVTTISDVQEFQFKLSAAGTFYIDWGDGVVHMAKKDSADNITYYHKYKTPGKYVIKFAGAATSYSTNTMTAVLSFYKNTNVAEIAGDFATLFPFVSDANQPRFNEMFSGCTNLTGTLPTELFSGVSGAPVSYMFNSAFKGTGLTGSLGDNFFGNLSGDLQSKTFTNMFDGVLLTGNSAKINGKYLYDIWPNATTSQVGGIYAGQTDLTDYNCMPIEWGGLGEPCGIDTSDVYKFSFTGAHSFNIAAAGTFYVDWGGQEQVIRKGDTTNTTYECPEYAECETIRLGGVATAYNTSVSTATISFKEEPVTSISGNLGHIFPTLESGAQLQPRFAQTFYGSWLTSVPAGLFDGISGAPVASMFRGTFENSTELQTIPSGLFAGISGAPAQSMFKATFKSCENLTEIPENLFGNISGKGVTDMFNEMFDGCTSLTGPSARINGQYLYQIWTNVLTSYVYQMYYGATGLDDYNKIPGAWK